MRIRCGIRVLVAVTACATVIAGAAPSVGSAAASSGEGGSRSVDVVRDTASSGEWQVVATSRHVYRLTWTSPRPLAVEDSRPEIVGPGASAGSTVVASNGALMVTVRSDAAPDPSAYDVVAAGRVLDGPGPAPASAPAPKEAASPPVTTPLTDDPGKPGPLDIVSSDYRLPATQLPGLAAKVEMSGHVVRPVRLDRSDPLVLFLHGRHEACYQTGRIPPGPQHSWPCGQGMSPVPSYLGYDYAQRLLASQGYVTVSISADGINAQDDVLADGGAADRAILVRRHLAAWVAWARSGRYAVDMSRVTLVGHSRGGEGVDRAAVTVPLSAPYTISGQILIAPTDFAHQTAAYVPTVTLLPYCDGDVSDLQGQQYTDIARDAAPDDTALHSSVLVLGANHNFFNSQWTPGVSVAPSFDDWGGPPRRTCGTKTAARLSAAEQRRVGATYIAGAVHLFTGTDAGVLPMFDGSAVRVASAGDADVRSEAVGGGRVLRRPGFGATVAPRHSATVRICRGSAGHTGSHACGSGLDPVRTPHWVGDYPPGVPSRPAFEMSWTDRDQSGGLTFARPLDLSTARSLDLRTVVDPRLGAVGVAVRLHDASGNTVATPLDHGDLPALPTGDYSLGKAWAQTLRVPLSDIPAGRRDAVTEVDLIARNARGRIWVLDIAAVPVDLAPAPHLRLPVLRLHTVERREGNSASTSRLRVPFTVSGDLTTQARITYVVSDDSTGATSRPVVLVIHPHTTSGTVDVPFSPNRVDDLAVRTVDVTAYATRGVMTGSYIGHGRIIDDDPSPRIALTAARRTVTEGAPARWRVSLEKPVNYYLEVMARPIRGGGRAAPLRVGDLPKKFRRNALFPVPPLRTPLWKTDLRLYQVLPPGRSMNRLTLPTLARPGHQGRRKVALRLRTPGRTMPGMPRTATVVVRDTT